MSTPTEISQALYFDDITREEVSKCSRADCIHHPDSAVGIDRMDFQTVMRTTKGLYIYLCDTCGQQALHEQGVVIAYDHDSCDSQKFAKVVAAVFSSKNVKLLSEFGFPKNSIVERENSDDADYIINNNCDDTVFTTLPGFNHLTRTSIKLANDDPDWVHCLAYDQSNEFALTLTVPDSDGVSAAAV
ncbi:hypothetical protein Pmar_PMAR020315, partial [Perkinsus marinus ATCC 50983]